jgi:DNA-binding NarL/FixJ family response regulator
MKIRILIIDDHPIVRHGMSQFINQHPDMQICCEASSHAEALVAMRECEHDLVIADISLDNQSGLELIKTLLRHYPQLPILVMSMHDESLYAERVLHLGAKGYLMKSQAIAHIQNAISTIMAGGIYLSDAMQDMIGNQNAKSNEKNGIAELTDRELEMLRLMGQGLTTKEIAQVTLRSVKTIESHRDNLRHKLNLKSGAELMRYAALWLSEQYGQTNAVTSKTDGLPESTAASSPLIRIALVEDNVHFQHAMEEAIRAVPDMALQGLAGTRAEGLRMLEQEPADVLLVDLGLPDGSGIEVIRAARVQWPDCSIVVNTMFGDETQVVRSLEAGASGYLLKDGSPEKLVSEIRGLHGGGSPISPLIARLILQRFHQDIQAPALTVVEPSLEKQPVTLSPREQEVLVLITQGFTLEEAAVAISVSYATVASFMRRIFSKLAMTSKTGAS